MAGKRRPLEKLPRRRTHGRAAITLALGLIALGRAVAAENPPGEVLQLPPMIVEESKTSLNWQYLELPGYQLLTVCGNSTATEFARRNHRLGELLRVLVPDRFLFKSSVPETYILLNEEANQLQSQEVVREMLSQHGAKVGKDGSVIARPDVDLPDEVIRVGFRTIHVPRRRGFFMPNMRLWDLDALAVFSLLPESRETPNFTFTDDRVQFLLELRTPALPDWFVEGVEGLYRRVQLGENGITVLPAVWLSTETEAMLRDPKQPRHLMAMADLLAYHRPAGGAVLSERDQLWRAQCALFVRWAFSGKGATRRESLWRLVDRLETAAPTEELFEECFGFCFADMHRQLDEYLPTAVNNAFGLDAPPGERLPRLKLRPATDLEIACMRGDWERMEIDYVRQHHGSLAEKYVEQARTTLRRVYGRGERDPRLLALLGLTELEAGDKAAARDFLEAAARGGKIRPRAALELARLRYAALPAEGELTVAQVAEVLAPLYPVLPDAPPLFEGYALMVTVWNRCATPPGAEELARFKEGVRWFPGASTYVLQVIRLNVLGGRLAGVREMAEAGLRHARVPLMQERFQRVLAELNR